MYQTGIAKRSLGQPDPVLHLVVVNGSQQNLWCSGGAGLAGINTMHHRRCTTCMALAREFIRDYEVADDEATEFDWYIDRDVPHRPTEESP